MAIEPGLPLVSGLFALALWMGANGVATLIEQTGTSPPLAISARRFTPTGGWEPPTTLVSLDYELDNRGKLGVSANGDATFAVVLTDGRLVTTSRAANAPSWSPLVALGAPGRDCHPGSVAVDDKGEALVACAETYPTGGSATFAAIRSRAGVWSPLEPVSSNKVGGSDLAEAVITREGRELLFVLTAPRDADQTESYELLERVAGKPWKPITMPFGDTTGQVFFSMTGGRGPGVVALHLTLGTGVRYVTYGLESDFLVEPTSGMTPVHSGTAASVCLAGTRTCTSARPCHTERRARLVVHTSGAKRSVSRSIERLRGANWRQVRSVRVRIRSHNGHATIQLPRGLVRVSTAAVPDARTHAWVAYLRVA